MSFVSMTAIYGGACSEPVRNHDGFSREVHYQRAVQRGQAAANLLSTTWCEYAAAATDLQSERRIDGRDKLCHHQGGGPARRPRLQRPEISIRVKHFTTRLRPDVSGSPHHVATAASRAAAWMRSQHHYSYTRLSCITPIQIAAFSRGCVAPASSSTALCLPRDCGEQSNSGEVTRHARL